MVYLDPYFSIVNGIQWWIFIRFEFQKPKRKKPSKKKLGTKHPSSVESKLNRWIVVLFECAAIVSTWHDKMWMKRKRYWEIKYNVYSFDCNTHMPDDSMGSEHEAKHNYRVFGKKCINVFFFRFLRSFAFNRFEEGRGREFWLNYPNNNDNENIKNISIKHMSTAYKNCEQHTHTQFTVIAKGVEHNRQHKNNMGKYPQ